MAKGDWVAAALLSLALLLWSPRSGLCETAAPGPYTVKPSDVVLPQNLKPGQYRRITTPFENWTLICDENTKARTKICNVSQSIVDGSGRTAFSWSLAANAAGKPHFILRAPIVAQMASLKVGFDNTADLIVVQMDQCDATVCVAITPVGPLLKKKIKEGATAHIEYTSQGNRTAFDATLGGLTEALSAIGK